MPLLCGPKYVGWAFQREFNKDTQVPFYWGDNVKIIFADVQDSGQMEKCLDWSHNIGDHLLIKERSTCCKPSPEPRTRYIPVLFWLEAKYWGSGCITCWQRTNQRLTNICRIKVSFFLLICGEYCENIEFESHLSNRWRILVLHLEAKHGSWWSRRVCPC